MRFVIVGSNGYIARRHVASIYALGHQVVGCYDPYDGAGWMDAYDKGIHFFKDDCAFIDWAMSAAQFDYAVICSPNHTHFFWINTFLFMKKKVICEKPLVTTASALYALLNLPNINDVNCILQLRLHPNYDLLPIDGDITMTYRLIRGSWYDQSWKGDHTKSGGLLLNFIHGVDCLLSKWGLASNYRIEEFPNQHSSMVHLEIDFANGKNGCLDVELSKSGTPIRQIRGATKTVDFSTGFENLHTKSYEEILAGRGFKVRNCLPSLNLCLGVM